MRHVFVETNWLVGCLAPAHLKLSAALELLEKAKRREVKLYLPAICLAECQRPIREKFQVRQEADRLRQFLSWSELNGTLRSGQEETVRRTLDQMEGFVKRDLNRLPQALSQLCAESGVELFHIQEEMWVRITELSHSGLELEPFDQAILGSILVKAELLREQGVDTSAFCEVDSDLQPWGRKGEAKKALVALYDQARIWVYGDFLMQAPPMLGKWPE